MKLKDIPEGWQLVRLGDKKIAEIRGNKTINGFDNIAFIPMDFIPDSGLFVKYDIRKLKDIKSFTYCESGDLLLAKITPSLENGKQGIVPDDIPNGFALATTEVFPIVCKGIDKFFLFYILKFPKFRKILEYSMSGTTGRQRVPKKAVQNLLIPIPPLPEQRKIAEILSTVDNAIQKVSAAIARTERLKKGLMQRLLTKGIDHKRFKFSKELGCEIPEEWEVVRLGEVADIKGGKRLPKGHKLVDYKTPYPYIRVSDFENLSINTDNIKYLLSKTYKIIKNYTISSEDVYISIAGTIGLVGLIPKELDGANLTENAAKLTNLKRVKKEFLAYILSFNSVQEQINRLRGKGTQPKLALFRIKTIKIPLPPLHEQQKIAEILSTVDKKLELEKERKEKLERIKNGLMNDLLTGRRRVKVEV